MGDIIYKALTDIFGSFIAATVILPAAIIFVAYLIYIIVMTIKELRKKQFHARKPGRILSALASHYYVYILIIHLPARTILLAGFLLTEPR